MTTTPLAEFLTALWERGQVSVPALPSPREPIGSPADIAEAVQRLRWYASEERAALPGVPPTLDDTAAMWGLVAVFTACSLIVHRQHTVESVASRLDCQSFDATVPETIYSVDLALRFLPDVHRLAMTLSENDPLCDVLERLGRRWPVSSVGMQFREPKDQSLPTAVEAVAPWWDHVCLRQLYLDRIIERDDTSRLTDRAVAEAVRAAIGIHGELSPKMTTALKSKSFREGEAPAEPLIVPAV